uniref:Uncharacterized protein AlNc14C364G11035 n=1 Tax=Albugo laibachii Nc14 TaxID=890382 RepID=F0WXU8_9STRA|nr:conserved hypothetical protein [Albugo laibachii Nc14]|eukprot:CCA26296.1 conserved hypothetical protein [Albugo laibachii Nc14]
MSIHFKFKSAKDFDTVNFPGTVIRVIDLKKAIVEKKKLNKGLDFDLVITDAQNGKVYDDENLQLARNTSVTVKRIPSLHPGSGLLARMKAEAAAVKATQSLSNVPSTGNQQSGNGIGLETNDTSSLVEGKMSETNSTESSMVDGTGAQTMEDELAALQTIHEQAEDIRSGSRPGNKIWTAQRGSNVDRVSNYHNGPVSGEMNPVSTGGGRGSYSRGNVPGLSEMTSNSLAVGPPGANARGRPGFQAGPVGGQNAAIMGKPPNNYVCYRCGIPGHYIQNCPTNGDPEFDQHRVKKKTGIPKSFMKAVNDPSEIPVGAGKTVVNAPWGGLAVIEPQNKNFSKLMAKSGGSATLDQLILSPPDHLACPICKRLMNDAVLIPCCSESACDECLRAALIDRNLVCVLCNAPNMSPEKLLPNKVLRASVDEFLRRARTEQQEREQLVKEAEQKALAKQKAATLASTSTTGRTGQSADAVLDIKKAGRKEENEEDDEFGGDIFGNIDEKEDNGKNLQPSVVNVSVSNANTHMSPALTPAPGTESVPMAGTQSNIAASDISLNGIVATKTLGDGPPGTTPTQEFPGNNLAAGNEQGNPTLQQQHVAPPPLGNHGPPMGNQAPWIGPGLNSHPQNGMGYMRPDAWFDGPRPPGPWFDTPGMPWYDGPFPGGPMGPRGMKGGRGRGYPPLHGGFYGAPDCFGPHGGPPDYFGPPPPWFDGGKPPYGNGAGRGDSQSQGKDQAGPHSENKSEAHGRSHSKDHIAGSKSHYSPNVNENGKERGRSRNRAKVNRSNRTFRRGRSRSRNRGRGEGTRKSKYSRGSRSKSRSQNKSRSKTRSRERSKHHSPCTRRSPSRNAPDGKTNAVERRSRSRERSSNVGKKDKVDTRTSKKVEESSKDIKIDQIGAPAIDLDFLNDEMIDDADEVHVKEQDKVLQGVSPKVRKSRSRDRRSPAKRISSNRSQRASTSRHHSSSSGHKRHHSTSFRRRSVSRSRRSIRGDSRGEQSDKKSVKRGNHSTSHGRERRGREISRERQREREREREKTRERQRNEKERSTVKSQGRIRDGDKRKRKETKRGRDVVEEVEEGKGKRRRGQEKDDGTQGKETSAAGSTSKSNPHWERDEGSRHARNQTSTLPNNSGKRHIEYEDDKDRKKNPGTRLREESRASKSRGNRNQAKKRSVLDRLGPALG